MISLSLKLGVLGVLIITMAATHQASRFIVGHGYGLVAIAGLLIIAAVSYYRER